MQKPTRLIPPLNALVPRLLGPKTAASALVAVVALSFLSASPASAGFTCENLFEVETMEAVARMAFTVQRMKAAEQGPLEISPGRNVFLQSVKPETPDQPYFLFLPGSNRSFFIDENSMPAFIARGYGVGTLNFSTQPHSVSTLKEGVRPDFYSRDYRLEDFAKEVELVIAKLQAQGIKNIIPVSLSYSGSVSPYLGKHDIIIETSPMTSTGAAQPQLKQALEMQKIANFWNPIFGPGITRAFMDNAYRDTWKAQVDRILATYNLPKERRQDFIEGYTSMSRAAEGAKWENFDLTKTKPGVDDRFSTQNAMPSAGARRVFILGGKESPSLYKHQLQTFLKLASVDPRTTLVVINASGHTIPSEQPGAFQGVLDYIVKEKTPSEPTVVFFDGDLTKPQSETNQLKETELKGDAAVKAVKSLIAKMP